MKTTTLNLENMSCGHCVKAVNNALTEIDGVEVQSVEMGKAEFDFNPDKVTLKSIGDVLSEEGYPVAE